MDFINKVKEFIELNLVDTMYFPDEDMKKHTTFKTGGTADLLVEPQSIDELHKLMKFVLNEEVPYIIIGRGSNLLVSDQGVRELVIRIDKNLSKYETKNETLEVEAGAAIIDVAHFAQRNSLSGLEFASGIPGTVGGAVFMNAGAYGGEVKDVLEEVLVLTTDGHLVVKSVDELGLGYRTSVMQRNGDIVLKAKFKLQKGNQEVIQNEINELKRKREESQPLELPSAGSTFKRPTGYFAGKLIQDAGLKGYRIGGAQVSLKHAGFVVNSGNASSSDIYNLIRHIQAEVKKQFGVTLETEVKLIGEFNH
ncbi:UDP-N-acetylmuramate dehydrogenase [Dethiobacter alkaliphilus]|uniref:UDP-N-acetylenolpyruvoylglucosamine reductase n=1 Tax=Dethiobacter alkaliphilus AHT 1 TaxID=555088 RepID=C0GFH7_DETAL|nr:UDP-N-acetylmuramate dehydrogenase [Dethiobacter alkaliphilus]EEG77937.1 UDP-N-acetylenolpyruvoylglucosamine reductase [Dethiobacter alkaliphilus AHT 1]